MNKQYDSRTADKFVVRLPEGLRAQVEQSAGTSDTSMNTVFIQALRQYLDNQGRQQVLLDALAAAYVRAGEKEHELQFQLKDREGSRRDWFEEAQRLQAMLAERDALLQLTKKLLGQSLAALNPKKQLAREIRDVLSASAEPSAPKCCKCNDTGEAVIKGAQPWDKRLSIQCDCVVEGLRAPVERDERAEFEQAFVVQEGVFFSKERNEYRSMNGRSIEYTDAEDLNLRLQGWQARAALERKKDNCELCGVTGIEPCTDCPGLDKATEGASHE